MEGYKELTSDLLKKPEGLNDLNRMLNKLFQVTAGDGENTKVFYGYGSPENVIVANIGSLYMRKDGGANTSIYVKESNNNAAIGWIAK